VEGRKEHEGIWAVDLLVSGGLYGFGTPYMCIGLSLVGRLIACPTAVGGIFQHTMPTWYGC
jgi:hypothetical protein